MSNRYTELNARRDLICPLPQYDNQEPFADVYIELENEHQWVRYTKAYCASWEKSEPGIGSGELIVGILRPPRIITTNFHTRLIFDNNVHKKVMESGDEAKKAEADRLKEYFQKDHVINNLIKKALEENNLFIDPSIGSGPGYQGHMLADFEKVLRVGISGFVEDIEKYSANCTDPDKIAFYKALRSCCDCLRNMCTEYADKAAELSDKMDSKTRAAELKEISQICRSISKGAPPQSFREALQLFWFFFLFDGTDNPGRFDQYMYPFYNKDMSSGKLTKELARILIEDMWHKMEQTRAWSLILGGLNKKGEDSTNELTYLCLDVTRDLRLVNPAVSVRVSGKTPYGLWNRTMKSIARGAGMPTMVNDEAIMPALIRSGISREDAYEYGLGGCIEYQIAGKCNFGGEDGNLNLAKCLELALNNGVCTMTGKTIGVATGNPLKFKTFEEVFDAYKKQVEYAADIIMKGCNIGMQVKAKQGCKIHRSLLIDDCIKRGLDCDDGGAVYGNGQIITNGLVIVSDSLAVIKHLVFEQKLFTMEELISAIRNNWEGYENLRLKIGKNAPRFGNDDERVDKIAEEAASHIFNYYEKTKTHRGGHFVGIIVYYTRQFIYGSKTGATPDGRYKGEVLEDCLGPWPGRDVNGPTAMVKSVTKLPLVLASGGITLNLKLSPNCLKDDEQIDKSIDLVKTYFKLGGQHVQITVVNTDDLRAAMKEPEKWRHIIVRVGGFSAYFTDLNKDLQESIIMRNENIK